MTSPAEWLGQRLDELSGRLARQRLAPTAEDAQDLVQDLVLRLLEGDVDLSLARNLGGYLWTALKHRALDRRKSLAWRREVRQVALDEDWMAGRGPDQGEPTGGHDLDELLAGLPAPQRDIIRAHSLEGRPYAELAREWQVPEGTLMARHKRGLDSLRRLATDKAGCSAMQPDAPAGDPEKE